MEGERVVSTPQQKRRRLWDAEYAAVRPLVLQRNQGMCERCNERPSLVVHHRGGRVGKNANRWENLAALCAFDGQRDGCHEWIHAHPEQSYRDGWLLHKWEVA